MSLWVFLNLHNQIISSKLKESVDILGWKSILDEWPDLKNDNVYLEATPHLFTKTKYNFSNIRKFLPFNRFCAICVLRNHIDYLVSLVTKDGFYALDKYIASGGLYAKQLDMLSNTIGRENMFIVHLKDIEKKQSSIYKFLNLKSDISFEFPYLNSFLDNKKRRQEFFTRRREIKPNFGKNMV